MKKTITLFLLILITSLYLKAQDNECFLYSQIEVIGTSLGSPLDGPFAPDEEVYISVSIGWQAINCNWLHGLVPTFGSGWSPSSFNALGEPEVILPLLSYVQGASDWYTEGSIYYKAIESQNFLAGEPISAGWFVTGTSPGPNFSNCDQAYLWDPNCSCGITQPCNTGTIHDLIFKLKTRSQEECNAGLNDLSVSFKAFSDIETGGGPNEICIDIPPFSRSWEVDCNALVDIRLEESSFKMYTDETLEIDFTDFVYKENPEVSFTWHAENPDEVQGAYACTENCGSILSQSLSNSNTHELKVVDYWVTAIHPDGTEGVPTKFSVEVYPNLTVNILPQHSTPICAGTTPVTLEADVYGGAYGNGNINGGDYGFFWSNGAATPSITVVPEESTTYTLTITDLLLTTTTVSFEVKVEPKPNATLVIDPVENPCAKFEPSSISFDSGSEQYDIKWTGPNMMDEDRSEKIIYPQMDGFFDLKLIDPETGCYNSLTTYVQGTPPVHLGISASSDVICQSFEPIVQLYAQKPGGNWSGNVDANGRFTPSEIGLQTLTYSYQDETTGCFYSESLEIEVEHSGLAPVTWVDEILPEYCVGLAYTFCVDPPTGAGLLHWKSENAIINDIESSPNCKTITWTEMIEAPLICVQYEGIGCLSPEECLTNIQLVDLATCAVSTQEVAANNFNLYPNPAEDWLTIESEDLELIRIIDARGKLLLSRKLNNDSTARVDLSNFANGLYYVMINNKASQKLIINR